MAGLRVAALRGRALRGLAPRLAGVAGLAAALLAADAAGHVVFSRGSLRQFLQHSAVSLRVAFVSDVRTWEGPDGDRQEYFRVRVFERLAGRGPSAGELDFFPHAEGFPAYGRGDRALLFLERTEQRPEFAGLARRFPWFSVQDAGEEWILEPGSREDALAWARELAAWLAGGGRELAGLRALVVRGLRADAAAVGAVALKKLVRSGSLPGMLDDPDAVAEVAGVLRDAPLRIGERGGLFALLATRPGFDPGLQLPVLRARASGVRERVVLVRQLAGVPHPAVDAWLAALATHEEPRLRRAAVAAQARRGARADLALLERALGDPDSQVARAAIRSLGSLEAPAARRLLEEVASGADPERARWAAAELRRRP